ncbi:hypothetical protein C8R43DRAFT_1241704 [Mycena crocata]|nr:hypothetical protein C8R43DRAFT_1241704 [Mycena crocata]
MLFFPCKRFRDRRSARTDTQPGTGTEARVEPNPLSPRAPTQDQTPPLQLEIPPPADPDLHRPVMPPTPPSSSSLKGLFTRIRFGRTGARVRNAPGEFQGAAAAAHAHSPVSPRQPTSAPTSTSSPTSAHGAPHALTPAGSLLNPRVNAGSAHEIPTPTEWSLGADSGSAAGAAGWRRGAEVSSQKQQPPTMASSELPMSPTDGLLRPSLAALQAQSSRTLGDHEDFSRPIGARVAWPEETSETELAADANA